MKQSDLTARFVQRPQNYAWFLGAGASRNSGLPTATDILLDLKRRYYRQEENQDISPQDIQNEAVQTRIQSFMDSRGFPARWSENEYTTYFEKIFGENTERQRQYISAILSEDKVALSVGNRVLGALMSEKLCRAVFTTNFDTVVEKAIAEMSGRSLSAYHLEGAHNAKNALDNEEYPFYCKLHGDFRYDSIKNFSSDLEKQNDALSACLVNAGNRFGFIVVGYSGRDKSVMELFHQVLETQNPFPHGLYWTGIKGTSINPAVTVFLEKARNKDIDAQYVEIETFDSFMLRLWRNIDGKPPQLDTKVRKARLSEVNIELTPSGQQGPVLRLNAFPILSTPQKCLSLTFKSPKDWGELREAT
ncbi:SIR2 family protein [Nitrosovibrio tenuis]|uniref:SIR2-like domain-containing protein n=1 Tax=Nitrosovibrio tenuis TaxID=1233 RepID=A0A1H7PU90_9PROT|nr:SIR2 family protein [Nitrosovibrio tenuis]SEL38805.1 SIR2-like domain-containing protein [Nitrosovibrio tenuis]